MAFSILTQASKAGTSANTNTTTNINTTNAKLIVVACGSYTPGGIPTLSDSQGNTWTLDNSYADSQDLLRFFYCINPSISVSHNFTYAGTGCFPCLSVLVIGGDDAAHDAGADNGNSSTDATVQTGPVTPSVDNSIAITGVVINSSGAVFSVDSPFTIRTSANGDASNGNSIGVATDIQTTATTRNPTWTNGFDAVASITVFKPFTSPPVTGNPFFTTIDAKRI